MAEVQTDIRQKLVNSLMRITHPEKPQKGQKRDNVSKLDVYVEHGLTAAKIDPELLAHFIAWNDANGKIRDSKVALPPLALRGLTKEDADLAENAVAHLLLLSPRDLVRAYDFSKRLSASGTVVPAGWRRMIEKGINLYLEVREKNTGRWDRTVLQHRESMKRLYRLAHRKPSDRAQNVLFGGPATYPAYSIFSKVAALRTMIPREAAGTIIENKIPFEVAVGAVAKAKDKDVVLALIEGMTGNQIITNTQMLQKFGVMNDPALKAAFEAALDRAKKSGKVETLKAGRAAERLAGTEAADKLAAVQAKQTEKLGTIEGDWLVLGDKSGSMGQSIELARRIASLIAERVAGEVHLVFFDTAPTYFAVGGKTYDEILALTRRVTATGNTSIGCGLDYVLSKNQIVNGIAIASDGGQNTSPSFANVYERYVKAIGIEPPIYFFRVTGDRNLLSAECKAAQIQIEEFDMETNVDYYSMPGIVTALRVSRYALYDEIMETKLRTFDDVIKEAA